MEFADVLSARRMHRDFLDVELSDEVAGRIVNAGLRGPSAGFAQGLELLVLKGESRHKYFEITRPETWGQPGMANASLVVLPIVDPEAYLRRYQQADKVHTGMSTQDGWAVPYWWVDAGAAAMAMLLAAANEGVGALLYTLGGNEAAVLEAFGVPLDRRCSGPLVFGIPANDEVTGSAATRQRRPAGESIHIDVW